ncbi:hypothetical protein [Leucobacter musarum]|uniref:hypothetical protein n=1 Tax=Leucobacter musarum TaxID=1930747 RepID=UPI0006A78E39|nr:hypothetical protein [Leucobacter musarum]
MTDGPRRGVTRGYVGALIGAAGIAAVAVLVAVWGGLALALDREPVTTDGVAAWTAPVVILVALIALAVSLWASAIALLRGRRSPSWGIVLGLGFGVYLWWCLAGMLGGMSVAETWFSAFALGLAIIWGLAALAFWAVLARRVYTDRPAPRWPWERDEAGE